MELKTLGDAVLYLGGLAAALTAIGVVVKFAVIGPFRRFVERCITAVLVEIRDRLAELADFGRRFDRHLVELHGQDLNEVERHG